MTPEPAARPAPGRGARVIRGSAGAALYEIHLPARWNGRLVLYAHGFRDPAEPLSLRDQDDHYALRDLLVADGFAFAASSYAQNGLAFGNAARSTHRLGVLFARHVREPRHTYLVGHSLGAVGVAMLAERFCDRYAGALVISGQLAGSQRAADYVAHVRVLFDFFYPGVLPGDAMRVPEGVDLQADALLPALRAMQSSPEGAGALARIMAALDMHVPAADDAELVQSLLAALGYNFRALPDLYRRTGGRNPFHNLDVRYGAPGLAEPLLAELNRRVQRFRAAPEARRYLERYYRPTGALRIPVLSLFNRRDPVSPPFHERAYREAAEAAGAGALLAQRPARAEYGHCILAPDEMLLAFRQLVGWAERGTKPPV